DREEGGTQARKPGADPVRPPRTETVREQRIGFPAPPVGALARAVEGEIAQPLARQARVLRAPPFDQLVELGVGAPVWPLGSGAALIEVRAKALHQACLFLGWQ